jgi:hypothetical protein
MTNACERCASRAAVGRCCSSHGKNLCHGCYRRTHFVEVCVAGCALCAAEGLTPSTAPTTPLDDEATIAAIITQVGAASAGGALGGQTGALRMALRLANDLHVAPWGQQLADELTAVRDELGRAEFRERQLEAALADCHCRQPGSVTIGGDERGALAAQPQPACICPRFRDTGGFRIADLACPVHGVGGTEPGDGYWPEAGAAAERARREATP